jgi:nucleoside 2-deoxyribosyltransferase
VFPIGSGDVFTACFAWAWGENGQDPVEAAHTASLGAAQWCGSAAGPSPFNPVDDRPTLAPTDVDPRIYLAGPFFSLSERWLVDLTRDGLRDLGASVFSPFHDVGPGEQEVAKQDLEGLTGCDAILGLLDGSDPGTFFEIGFGAGKYPTITYAEKPNPEGWKMVAGTDAEVHDDLSTAVYHAIWAGMRKLAE